MGPLVLLPVLAVGLGSGIDDREAADPSLTVAEYIKAGVPSPDRVWSGPDYAAAGKALAKIKADRKDALPRQGSAKSGAVFARIISEENFVPQPQSILPVNIRMGQVAGIIPPYAQILVLYLDPNPMPGKRQEYGPELLEIFANMLRIYDVMLRTLEEFAPTLDPKERSNPVRVGGLRKVRSGLGTTLTGVLMVLDERDQYENADLEALASRLPDLVPPLWPWLDESVRQELAAKLETLANGHPSEAVRKALKKLQGRVKEIKDPPKDPFK